MKSNTLLSVLLALVIVGGLSYAGVRYFRAKDSHVCSACRRSVDHGSRAVALVNGKQQGYCCPSCAMSEHEQTGARVEIQSLTDQNTGKPIEPGRAFLVQGSDINPCAHHHNAPGPDKRPMDTHYDRCSPSILAFATREQATQFAREHGGQVMPFASLAARVR